MDIAVDRLKVGQIPIIERLRDPVLEIRPDGSRPGVLRKPRLPDEGDQAAFPAAASPETAFQCPTVARPQ